MPPPLEPRPALIPAATPRPSALPNSSAQATRPAAPAGVATAVSAFRGLAIEAISLRGLVTAPLYLASERACQQLMRCFLYVKRPFAASHRLGDGGLQLRLRDGADDLLHHLAALEDQQGRDGPDPVLLRSVL